MQTDNRETKFADEIAEIEDLSGKRRRFMILGILVAVLLAVIVVFGGKEHRRLATEAARPKSEDVALGEYFGRTATQAIFTDGSSVRWVDGVTGLDIDASTRYARPLTYGADGVANPPPEGVAHWSITSADTIPFIIEPIQNPLIGITPSEYLALPVAEMTAGDYRSGGPNDWVDLEAQSTNIQVTGIPGSVEGATYLVDGDMRIRMQGIEGLSGIDSLEMLWATTRSQDITAFGRISSTPQARRGRRSVPADAALFLMTVTAIHPPGDPGQTAPAAEPTTP